MIWAKNVNTDELRVRQFFISAPACSETAASLSAKLGLNSKRCRRALDQLVSEGMARRRDFRDIASIYYRNPSLP